MFPGNNAFRCGAAGTQLFKNADLVYGAERSSSFTGLLGRMTMYKNYWLPLKGRLYAALRIRKQLIARPGQRVGIDSFGAQYNIDRGNQTLVLQREAEMHAEMDKQGLRWQQDKRNELFAPRKSVQELIDAMRTIRGEDMYLFDSETIREDTSYDGGRERAELVMTKRRELPTRAAATEVSAPTRVSFGEMYLCPSFLSLLHGIYYYTQDCKICKHCNGRRTVRDRARPRAGYTQDYCDSTLLV